MSLTFIECVDMWRVLPSWTPYTFKKQEEISISIFPLTPEKGFAFSQQKTRMGEGKTTQKSPRHFKSHLCSNDTRARDKKCVCGFSFRKGGLIKMEPSFLPLHYFGRNFLYNHILLWSLFLLYEALLCTWSHDTDFNGGISHIERSVVAGNKDILEFPLSLFMDFNYHPTHL